MFTVQPCPICSAPYGFHEDDCGNSVPIPSSQIIPKKTKQAKVKLTDAEIAQLRVEAKERKEGKKVIKTYQSLIDIVHEAVETHSNPWAILSTWELWNHYNGAPTMTLCEGPQGRVICSLLTDPTSEEMPRRWLYVDVSDAEIPSDFDDWIAVYSWLENYMLTAFPETVTALADGHALVALEIREFAERLGDYRFRVITSKECTNKETP